MFINALSYSTSRHHVCFIMVFYDYLKFNSAETDVYLLLFVLTVKRTMGIRASLMPSVGFAFYSYPTCTCTPTSAGPFVLSSLDRAYKADVAVYEIFWSSSH